MLKFAPFYIILFFLFFGGMVNAQKLTLSTPVNNKKYIILRPCSRDYGPTLRNNSYQRVENVKEGTKFLFKRPVLPQYLIQQNKNNLYKNLQRRQINSFHRPL